MKEKLHLKTLICSFLVLLLASTSLFSQEIIFVYNPGTVDVTTGEPADMPTIRLLEETGYTVHPFTKLDLSTASQEQLDSLGNADLIYIGRTVTSGNFESPKKELWHAISTPIITGQMWALRSNKMNWFQTEGCSNIDDPIDAVFTADVFQDDQVFEGLSGTFDWWVGPYSTINVTDAGNGQVLATKTGENYVVFARFEAGVEFYSGSVDAPAGPRTYLGSASDNKLDGDGNKIYNYLGFTDQSKKILLNEIAIMTGVYQPPVDVKRHSNSKLSVFPVPASDYLNIEMDNLKKVDVMNMAGKYFASYTTENNKLSMDVSNFKNGVYFLKITNDNGDTRIRKITVK